VSVTAPPELISTNFDTVALIVTVPVVDCPKQQTAQTTSSVVSRNDLMIRRGIVWFPLRRSEIWLTGRQSGD
jgi:hypothetical protein